MVGTVVMSVFLVLNVYVFVRSLRADPTGWVKAYREINWPLMLVCIGLAAGVVAQVIVLYSISEPLFGFGWISLINSATGEDTPVTNTITAGLNIRFLGLALCLLILTQLPKFARLEEEAFRAGTKNWKEAVPRSLRFGFLHMVVGVPLGAALAISVFGLVLTAFYFRGGVELSTKVHFQYNLLIFTLVTISAALITFS